VAKAIGYKLEAKEIAHAAIRSAKQGIKNAKAASKHAKQATRMIAAKSKKLAKAKTIVKSSRVQHVITEATRILKKDDKLAPMNAKIDSNAAKAETNDTQGEKKEKAAAIAEEKKEHLKGLGSVGLPDNMEQWKKWQAKKDKFNADEKSLIDKRFSLGKKWLEARELAVGQTKVVRYLTKKAAEKGEKHESIKNVTIE
jgi:hypothetical protein